MKKLALSALLFSALIQSLASANCVQRCRLSIDPGACQRWCEANPIPVPPSDEALQSLLKARDVYAEN